MPSFISKFIPEIEIKSIQTFVLLKSVKIISEHNVIKVHKSLFHIVKEYSGSTQYSEIKFHSRC